MNRQISRRNLLAAASSAGLLLPLLGRSVSAGTLVSPGRPRPLGLPSTPKRLVVMQSTNGVMSEWWPTGSGTSFTLSDTQSPLAPHQQDIIVVQGLGYQCQLDTTNGGVGHQSCPFMLTGVQGAQSSNQAGPDAIANGVSLDQYVVQNVLKGVTPIPSLELGAVTVDRDNNSRSISFNGPAQGDAPDERPPEIDPINVYNRIVGLIQSGDAGSAASAAANQLTANRKKVLDLVSKDLQAMSGRVGTDDRGVLAAHLAAAQALEAELGASSGGGVSCSPATQPTGYQVDAADQLDTLLRLQLGLVTTAFACDLTRVVTVMMDGSANDGIVFPWLSSIFPDDAGGYLMNDHHGYAHAAGDGGTASGAPYKRLIDQWYMKLLADFIQGLKNVPEGDGTMFDNTVILWINNMGNGAAHNVDNIPIVVAGGSWYFKTGQYVQVPNGTPHNGLLTGLANAMGCAVSSFGDPKYGGELTQLKA